MPFGHREEIEELTRQRDEAMARVSALQGQIAVGQSVGRIAEAAAAELAKLQDSGIIDEEAEAMASVEVIAAERKRLTGEVSARLQRDEYDKYAAGFRTKEGPGIIAGLRTLFETDGTYDRLRKQAEDDVRAELSQQVLTEIKSEVRSELEEESAREKIMAEIRGELMGTEEMARMRTEERQKLEHEWHEEVQAAVVAEIEAEEAARESDFKAAYTEEVRGARYMTDKRKKVREELEARWKKATQEEVAAAIDDEELRAVLEERARHDREKLDRLNKAEELLQNFEGVGVDMTQFGSGSKIEVYLGDYKEAELKRKRPNSSYDETYSGKVVAYRRKLTLSAIGGGKFIVDGDSLSESTSVYERKEALIPGVVIVAGRKVSENHEAHLDHVLAADVPFYYDDDTSHPTIVDAMLPVANLMVDGISARHVDVTQMAR